jgi:type IV pilus assembly protein PilY1
MRAIRPRHVGLLLVLGLVLPFATDAGTTVPVPPASGAACCNLASSFATGLNPGGNGDEGFFGVPIGAPANAMILLDTSGSMTDFPKDIQWPSLSKKTGTCSGEPNLDAASANQTDTPYDNGNVGQNSFTVDDPPWGLNRCLSAGANKCLFKGSSYYKYNDWGTDYATEYTSGSAASGNICYEVKAAGANAATISACQTCLDTKGYYLFLDNSSNQRAFFRGRFLNAYPPKFVAARRVVKKLVYIDPNVPTSIDSVRFGLTIFQPNAVNASGMATTLRADDGGLLIVPLGPDCDTSLIGFNQSNASAVAIYKQARQAMLDAVNNPAMVYWGSYTPLAETLYNIGQYFSDTTVGSTTGGLYDSIFGSSWIRASTTDPKNNFRQTSAGAINAPWATSGNRQASICWACQQSSAIVVTDGLPTKDNNLPRNPTPSSHTTGPTPGTASTNTNNDFRKWSYSGFSCPAPGCGTDADTGGPLLLHEVAYFLYHNDMRSDLPNTTQTQTVATYAISFGIPDPSQAWTLLKQTALLGGGKSFNTSSGDELENSLFSVVADTVARSTSFSVSNTNTLQTGNNNSLFLARFKKLLDSAWEGHVFRFKIFNEFVQGCDRTKNTALQTLVQCKKKDGTTRSLNPNLDGKEDCNSHAQCDGLYILDGDCDPVTEDGSGNFVKGTFNASHQLVAATAPGTCDPPGTTVGCAVPYWDAGDALSNASNPGYRSADETDAAKGRRIFTVIDRDGDGKFTAADGLVDFAGYNAPAIAPLLGIDNQWCADLLSRVGLCTTDPAAVTASVPLCPDPAASWNNANTVLCAKQIIYYIRGWDVLDDDNDNCAGPGNPGNDPIACPNGEQRDRANDSRADVQFWKLGDIFHSSPVVVKPPATEMICDLGLENQCAATIHSPKGFSATIQTPADFDINGNGVIDPGEDAYEKYRQTNATRRQLVLVGANDGMLHAFDAGAVDPSGTPDSLGQYPYLPGSGAELWAFIPPDLLPKLKQALDQHTYFVDGNIMVRDIWVDANTNGTKEPTEFHTLAVLSERSGGSSYSALDVTDPLNPVFRWTYPPNCTVDQTIMGQSWSGFAPRPPPIGPVKLAKPNGDPQNPGNRGFEERWIVMVNGGFDPAMTRGRGVWMMDAWTGQPIWRYTDTDFKTQYSISNSDAGMWPVPAAVALVDMDPVGTGVTPGDGFFDTANWPDMGGQLWVARFETPGTQDPITGLVTNWYAARAFEEQRGGTGSNSAQNLAGRSEFFNMTSNALDGSRLHSFLGSGNRDHLLQSGAACGGGNLLGCYQGGCSGDLTTSYDFNGCTVTSKVRYSASNGKVQLDKDATAGSCGAGFTCNQMKATVTANLACGAAGTPAPAVGQYVCSSTGVCSVQSTMSNVKLVREDKLTQPTTHNRFYGLWSYGVPRTFNSAATAATFDVNRFTDVSFAGSCNGPTGNNCTLVNTTYAAVSGSGAVTCSCPSPGATPCSTTKCNATSDDPGWFYEYGWACPTGATCSDPLPWQNERTASGSTILAGCVDWNTFRSQGSPGGTDPCVSQSIAARNQTYLSDMISGTPSTTCGFQTDATCGPVAGIYRSSQRTTVAPPPDPTQMVGIGMDGEVRYISAQIEPGSGASGTSMGSRAEISQPAFWLEVPRDLHSCRHQDAGRCR